MFGKINKLGNVSPLGGIVGDKLKEVSNFETADGATFYTSDREPLWVQEDNTISDTEVISSEEL